MPSSVMRPDEFQRAIRLLPPDLYERVRTIRSCVLGTADCPYCRIAARSLRLALDAAAYGDLTWARVLIDEAEHYFDARVPKGTSLKSLDLHDSPSPAASPSRWAGSRSPAAPVARSSPERANGRRGRTVRPIRHPYGDPMRSPSGPYLRPARKGSQAQGSLFLPLLFTGGLVILSAFSAAKGTDTSAPVPAISSGAYVQDTHAEWHPPLPPHHLGRTHRAVRGRAHPALGLRALQHGARSSCTTSAPTPTKATTSRPSART